MLRTKGFVSSVWLLQVLPHVTSQQLIQLPTFGLTISTDDGVINDNTKVKSFSTQISSGGVALGSTRSHSSKPFHFIPMIRRPLGKGGLPTPKTITAGTATSIQTSEAANLQNTIKMPKTAISDSVKNAFPISAVNEAVKNALPISAVNEAVSISINSTMQPIETYNLPTTQLPANSLGQMEATRNFANSLTTPFVRTLASETPNSFQTTSDLNTLERIEKLLVTMISNSDKNALPIPESNFGVPLPAKSSTILPEVNDPHSFASVTHLGSPLGNGGVPLSAVFPLNTNLGTVIGNRGVPLPAISPLMTPGAINHHNAPSVTNLESSTVTISGNPSSASNDFQMLRTLIDTIINDPIGNEVPMISNSDKNALPIPAINVGVPFPARSASVTHLGSPVGIGGIPFSAVSPLDVNLGTVIGNSDKNGLPIPAINVGVPLPARSSSVFPETNDPFSSASVTHLGGPIDNVGVPLSAVSPLNANLGTIIGNRGVPLTAIPPLMTPDAINHQNASSITNLENSTVTISGNPSSASNDFQMLRTLTDTIINDPIDNEVPNFQDNGEFRFPFPSPSVLAENPVVNNEGSLTAISDLDVPTLSSGLLVTNSEVTAPLGVTVNHSDLSILDDLHQSTQNSEVSLPDIPTLPSLDIREELDIKNVDIQFQVPKGTTEIILGKQQTKPETTAVTNNKLRSIETPVLKSLIPPAFGGSSLQAIPSAHPSYGAPIIEPNTYPMFPTQSTSYGGTGMQSHSTSLYSGFHHGGIPPSNYYIRVRRPVKQKTKEKDSNNFYERMKNWFNRDEKKDEKKVVHMPQPDYAYYPNAGTYEMPYYYPTSGLYGVPQPYQSPMYASTPTYETEDSGPDYWGYSLSLEGVNGETFNDEGGNGGSNPNRGPGESFGDDGENGAQDVNRQLGVTLSDITGESLINQSLITGSTNNFDNMSGDGDSVSIDSGVNGGPGVTEPDISHEKTGGSITLKWLSW